MYPLRHLRFNLTLASVVAYLVVNIYLDDFAYRTPIDLWVFGGVGLGAWGIALVTVGYQLFSAAIRNPVDTLKED